MKRQILYGIWFGIIAGIVVATHWQVVSFGFWKDDWIHVWNALYLRDWLSVMTFHPGSIIEFIILARLFGDNTVGWQVVGLLLRALTAFMVGWMVKELFSSWKAGIISTILFATSPIGVEAVGWPSGHIATIVALCLSVSVYYCLVYLRTHTIRFIRKSLLFLFFGFIAEPLRVVSLLPLFLLLWSGEVRRTPALRTLRMRYGVVLTALLAVYSFWQMKLLTDLQLVHPFVSQHVPFREVFPIKFAFMNYFSSIFHIAIGGYLLTAHELAEVGHGIPDTLHAIGGVMLFIMMFNVYFKIRCRHLRLSWSILFLILWILLSYIPVWLFEPRLVVTGVHRYLVIPSVGYYAGISYALSRLRNTSVIVLFVVIISLMQMRTVSAYYRKVSPYRLKNIITATWDSIIRIVPPSQAQVIIVYSGEEPMRTNMLDIAGSAAFALRHTIRTASAFPFMTKNLDEAVRFVCVSRPEDSHRLESWYGWHLQNDGVVLDRTQQVRESARTVSRTIGCILD